MRLTIGQFYQTNFNQRFWFKGGGLSIVTVPANSILLFVKRVSHRYGKSGYIRTYYFLYDGKLLSFQPSQTYTIESVFRKLSS